MNQITVLHAAQYLENDRDIEIHKSFVPKHYPLHCHDFIEIAYIASGKGRHIVDGDHYEIKEGDLFIFNENILHEFYAYSHSPLLIYNIIFRPYFIDGSLDEGKDFVNTAYQYLFHTFYIEDGKQSYIKFTGMKHENIENTMEEMLNEFQQKQDGYVQIIKANLTRLLIMVFRSYRGDAQQKQNVCVYKKLIIQNAVDYMKKNFSSNITCEFLANRVYLSVSYFSKIFKEETNKTVIQMLQKIRIRAAREKLKNTTLSVNAIMTEVGYSDIKYFYKIFRDTTNMTPGEYRGKNY